MFKWLPRPCVSLQGCANFYAYFQLLLVVFHQWFHEYYPLNCRFSLACLSLHISFVLHMFAFHYHSYSETVPNQQSRSDSGILPLKIKSEEWTSFKNLTHRAILLASEFGYRLKLSKSVVWFSVPWKNLDFI